METQSKQRGGKREGAGRKKTMEKRIQFCADALTASILEGVSNKSKYICEAVKAYKGDSFEVQ